MKKKLNPKQELFCKFYATDRDCFGNGVLAYQKVYSTKAKPITYKSAKTLAYQLLTNVDICEVIRKQIDIYISDEVVDKELGEVILQKGDLSSKVQAIREYNRVKNRVVTNLKILDPNDDLTDEELEEETNRRKRVRELEEKPKA